MRRICIYGAGMIFLAIGLTLNIKAGLGTAPVLTVPLTISEIWGLPFSSAVFAVYIVFVVGQIALQGKWTWKTVLQVPFSVAFSLLLRQFEGLLAVNPSGLGGRLLVLAISVAVTAAGIGMMVNTRLISNPADGLAATLGEKINRGAGTGKNILDLSCVAISCATGLLTGGTVYGVGAGTLISMLMVGRVLALFNRCFQEKIKRLSGL